MEIKMTLWHILHLVILALWGGLEFTEGVLEVLPSKRPDLKGPVIVFHYWIDLLIELPLTIFVVISGLFLLSKITIDNLIILKVIVGSIPVLTNLFCTIVVIQRGRRYMSKGILEQGEDLKTKLVFLSFVVGTPFAIVAVVLGFYLL